jgi:hypothetical protein
MAEHQCLGSWSWYTQTCVVSPQVYPLEARSIFITFINDSSKKLWVYFLKIKSNVFETYKK